MNATASSPQRQKPPSELMRFLVFLLGTQEFAIDILMVREIVARMPITRVPGLPAYVRGVSNLRGQIIPVMDLRLRLGMPPASGQSERCVVVIASGGKQLGLAVDLVQEVVCMAASEIETMPPMGSEVPTEMLGGIDRCEGRVRFILESSRLFLRSEEREIDG